ncbi:hypothetical protein K449DRAFT_438859 [Hypoxylon sp. EC38]|nr:hypothetical protein K449DRAFT_438859 [Hypoxylon sp. EC38]
MGQRHDAIRTAFYANDIFNQPMQGVLTYPPSQLEHGMVSGNKKIENATQEMRYHQFDLSADQSDDIGNQVFSSDLESAYRETLDSSVHYISQYPDFTVRQLQ